MRIKLLYILILINSFISITTFAQEQKKEKTTEELAAEQADKLGELLKLEDWQIFYVDSTLQHDYAAMKAELGEMKKAKVENYDLYLDIQDKWMSKIDSTYNKYFTPIQWKKYLKTGAGKLIKAREKRKAKRKNTIIAHKQRNT